MNLGATEILIIVIVIVFYLFNRKKKSENNTIQSINKDNSIREEQNTNDEIVIPDICPHCKNPNGKKIRLCEWCGNQIC